MKLSFLAPPLFFLSFLLWAADWNPFTSFIWCGSFGFQHGDTWPVWMLPVLVFALHLLSPEPLSRRGAILCCISFFLFFKTDWLTKSALIGLVIVWVILLRNLPSKFFFNAFLLGVSGLFIFIPLIAVTGVVPSLVPFSGLLKIGTGLKLLALTVESRVYQRRQLLDRPGVFVFFFHPVFFFVPNDLGVLLPSVFQKSYSGNSSESLERKSLLKLMIFGVSALVVYSLISEHLFQGVSERLGPVGSPNLFLFGFLSVITAVTFHFGNVAVQVGILRSIGFDLKIDMNKPWLARSPREYWDRMHYYIKDYLEVIVFRPLSMFFLRLGAPTKLTYFLCAPLVYLLFAISQIGFQPFRGERSLGVSFALGGIFLFSILIPKKINIGALNVGWSQRNFILQRGITLMFFVFAYTLVFIMRRSF